MNKRCVIVMHRVFDRSGVAKMKPDYGRTTITVPFELKKRMKKVRGQVNWSAVACEAFENKLEELGPVEEITSVEEAIKRMKAIGENGPAAEADKSGTEAGKHWAMNFAQPGQLKRIEAFKSSMSADEWEESMCSRGAAKELAIQIDPRAGRNLGATPEDDGPRRHRSRRRGGRGPGGHGPGGWYGPREVWRSILDCRPEHPAFFFGFAEGALEIWDQMKDQF